MRFKGAYRSLLIPVFLLVGVFFGAAFCQISLNAFAEGEADSEGGEKNDTTAHFVSLFYDDERTNVKTDARTVREALQRAKIELSDGDKVEPALDDEITADNFNINIYRARDVIVLDGSRKKHIKTASTNPADVAMDAGVKLLEADTVELVPYNNLLESGNVVAYRVKRAKTVRIDYYGKKISVRTQAKTVAKLLSEREIDTDREKNWISVSLKTVIKDGMSFSIQPQGIRTITVEEMIAHGEKTIQDYDLEYGKRQIIKAGANGSKTVTYEVNMRDGIVLSRKKLSEIVTKAPITQEVKLGMKLSLPAGSHEDWMAAAGISPSDYGYVNYIISHESSWRPNATNGKYWGLYQTSKARLVNDCGSNWVNDPVCQLRSATGYANSRYGSWANAYQRWRAQGWW